MLLACTPGQEFVSGGRQRQISPLAKSIDLLLVLRLGFLAGLSGIRARWDVKSQWQTRGHLQEGELRHCHLCIALNPLVQFKL